MNKELHDRLNQHLGLEFGAAHNYLAMALWFEGKNLPGFAAWMRRQSQEEIAHAHRFIDHMVERDLQVVLPAIAKPPDSWGTAHQVVEQVMASERKVTESIDQLYDVAERVSDRAALTLLQWFVNEQVEEESMVRALLGRLELAGDQGVGLLLIDQELGQAATVSSGGGTTTD